MPFQDGGLVYGPLPGVVEGDLRAGTIAPVQDEGLPVQGHGGMDFSEKKDRVIALVCDCP